MNNLIGKNLTAGYGGVDIIKDINLEVNEGEMIVVPKGVDHKPTAENECHVMLVEPKGILNTGNVKGDLTAPNDEWI